MGKTPNLKSRKEWEGAIWPGFLEDIKRADSKKKIARLLDNILSSNEKKLISKRLAALTLIRAGASYKEIGRILWISPSTVSALKKSIHKAAQYQSNRYYAGRSKDEKRKNMKSLPSQTIFDYWLNFPIPKKVGRGRWRFLSYQG